ncbi:MAG: helix-turn-helix domain-containing protein [Actinomycetota bacterium]
METTSSPSWPSAPATDVTELGNLYSAECECRDILDLVASKWSALIIGKLEEEPHRFGELRRAIPGITQKMLTQTLRRLERDGLVDRTVLTQMRPPQVEYSLTDLGLTVTEPLAAMRTWTEQHLPDVRIAREHFEEASSA